MEFGKEEEVDINTQLAYFDPTLHCDFIHRIYWSHSPYNSFNKYRSSYDLFYYYAMLLYNQWHAGASSHGFKTWLLNIQEFCKHIVKRLVACNLPWWEYLPHGITKSYKSGLFFSSGKLLYKHNTVINFHIM